MKKKLIMTLVLFVSLNVTLESQIGKNDAGKYYLGLHGGFSTRRIDKSNYYLLYGITMLYNYENNIATSSVTRGNSIYLNEKVKDHNNSYYNTIEFSYGKIYRLAEKHRLFNRVSYFFFTGLSYTSFNYFEDETAWKNNKTKHVAAFGIPINFGLSGHMGGFTYSNFVYRYHIVHGMNPNWESQLNFLINVF